MKPQKRQNLNRKQIILLCIISLLFLALIPIAIFSLRTTTSSPATSRIQTEVPVPKRGKSALKQVQNYSDVMHMSKQDLVDQLTSKHYSKSAINYAIKHVKIDYDQNALLKGKEYSDSQNMSKQGIYDQLISKGKFTVKQAQYAVDNLQVDYNQNALITAKNYQRDLGFSPAKIREVLISDKNEKFTVDQADYAIQHLND
ncbi:Ltp family lipoprotein [Companilactobacillus huachuanensis]|uniref:Ltp family lipoprotein n=1 Tax=Companilactobacillus huachuanensis TaxID=2559914 RepID=A0ABW1RQC1_9LACO|nr:Ltp family lipoprotein [Companilactobacillus huachuanensis]